LSVDQVSSLQDINKRLQEYNTSLQQYNSKMQEETSNAAEALSRTQKEKAAIMENLSTLRGTTTSLTTQLAAAKASTCHNHM
jgi:kinesin family protein C1